MAISRMQQPRQMYGLGSLVKKAVRGVKKIAKSPLGKAALLYAGTAGLGALGAGSAGSGFGWKMFAPQAMARNIGFSLGRMGLGSKFIGPKQPGSSWLSKLNYFKNPNLGFGQKALITGGLAATALPFLMGKGDEEEVDEESWTQVPSSIADIRNQAKNYYRNPDASTLAFMPGKQFVNRNFYAADGGRAGLLNGGEAGQEQIEQMLMAEFVKYKNQGGTLTFEQFVEAIMQQQQEGQGMEQPQEVMMAADGGPVPGSTVPGYTTPAGHNRFDYDCRHE